MLVSALIGRSLRWAPIASRARHSCTFRGCRFCVRFRCRSPTHFYKGAMALQILFVLGLVWAAKNRGLHDFVFREGLLLAPAAVLFVFLSFFNREQIGVRHILPFFAIDVIVAAAAFVGFNSLSRVRKVILCLLGFWLGGLGGGF